MKVFNFAVLFFCIASSNFYAQNRSRPVVKPGISDAVPAVKSCFTMQSDSLLRIKYKKGSADQYEALMKKAVDSYNQRKSAFRQEADTMIIPVIVHVVYNTGEALGAGSNITADQVYSQFDALNEDYNKKLGTMGYNTNPVGASMVIKFVPATISTDGTNLDEPGIDRYNGGQANWAYDDIENILKPNTIWDPTKYFNIWTVRFGGSLASTLGYTQFPSLSNLDGLDADEGEASTDGVVIRYNVFGRTGNVKAPYNLGRTATHEIGHFFGLRHIWGDQTNCKGTDYCDDTPKTSDAIYGCPTSAVSCTTGVQAMYQNYMDYTNDGCMNIFTNNQLSRMMAVVQNSPRRKELLTSNVYISISVPKAKFGLDKTTICKGSSIAFTDLSTRLPTTRSWTLYDANHVVITTAGLANFSYTFQQTGNFSVQLIAGNQFGYDTLFNKNCIQVISGDVTPVPYLESFEGTTVLGNWILYNPAGDSTWKVNNQVSAYGTGSKCVFYNNFDSTYDKTGFENGLLSPRFDLLASQDAYLLFDVAYAPYKSSTTGDVFADSLAIYYTTDCGQSYDFLWQKGGTSLATAPALNDFFTPSSSQWRKEMISLTPLNNKANVNFLILNKSGWGNALYVDNINILIPNRTSVPGSDFIATPTSVCGGGTISLLDRSTQYPTAWTWTITEKNNQTTPFTSNLQYPDITLDVPGTYNVKLVASNSFGPGTTNFQTSVIKAGTNPVISLRASATSVSCRQLVTFAAYGGVKYVWYNDRSLDPITTSTGYSIVDTLKYSTTYYVYGFDANGCYGGDYIDISVSGSCSVTGITDVLALNDNNFKIYPNPAEGSVFVEIEPSVKMEGLYFTLYNQQSASVSKTLLQAGKNTIPISGIVPGMYFYAIGNNKFGKLVVE